MKQFLETYVMPYYHIRLIAHGSIAKEKAALLLEYEKRKKTLTREKMIIDDEKRKRLKEVADLEEQYCRDNLFAWGALTACHSGDLSKIEQAHSRPSTWELFLQAGGLFVAIDGRIPAILKYLLNTGVDYTQANHLGIPAYKLIFGLKPDSASITTMQHIMLAQLLQDLKIEATPANLEKFLAQSISDATGSIPAYDEQQYSTQLKARWREMLAKHEAWWHDFVKEENDNIVSDFEVPELAFILQDAADKKTYDETLVLIANHYNKIAYQQEQEVRAQHDAMQRAQRAREEEEDDAMLLGMATAGLAVVTWAVSYPIFSSSLSSFPAAVPAIATSATVGLTTSLATGGNPLTGMIHSGVFAGFGVGVSNILDTAKIAGTTHIAIKSVAVASLSTAVYGGKPLTNIGAALAANFTAELVFPSADLSRGAAIGRGFVTGGVATAIAGGDLGQSILAASMSSMQSIAEAAVQNARPNSSIAALNNTASVIADPLTPTFDGSASRRITDSNFLATPGFEHVRSNVSSVPPTPVEIRMVPREQPYAWANNSNKTLYQGSRSDNRSGSLTRKRNQEQDFSDWVDSYRTTSDAPQEMTRRSVIEFMENTENRYSRAHLSNYVANERLRYGVGYVAGGAASGLRMAGAGVTMFATDDTYLRTGGFAEYNPNSAQIAAVENIVRTVGDIPKTGFRPLWAAYKQQHDDRMSEAARYRCNGDPFMAGFTGGSANMDVIIDGATVAAVGYGTVRGAIRIGSDVRILGSKIHNLTTMTPVRDRIVTAKVPTSLNSWHKFKIDHVRSTGARELSISEITRAEELAEAVYQQIRSNPNDIAMIAKNTGLKEFRIERIKNHLFFKEHELRSSIGRFDADPLIVESWRRLETGKFTSKDLQLLNHELFESKFEGIFKTDYLTSHNAANRAGYISPAEALNAKQMRETYRGFLHRFE